MKKLTRWTRQNLQFMSTRLRYHTQNTCKTKQNYLKRKVTKIRRVKKTFTYSAVKIIDGTTKEVLLEDKREGKQDESKVAVDYIKEHGYKPNLEITITEESRTFVQSAECFMEHGEEIIEEKTDAASAEKEGK